MASGRLDYKLRNPLESLYSKDPLVRLSDAGLLERMISNSVQEIFTKAVAYRHPSQLSLARYATVKQDLQLLGFILERGKDAIKSETSGKFDSSPGLDSNDFHFALERGNIPVLVEMIKNTGPELPLDALMSQSGVEPAEKSKYYQDLSIRSKKIKKWAQEGANRNKCERVMEDATPPYLQACRVGSLAATDWFLSDAPFRLYNEFGAANSEDPRLKTLARAHGGFDKAVGGWLKQRSMLQTS